MSTTQNESTLSKARRILSDHDIDIDEIIDDAIDGAESECESQIDLMADEHAEELEKANSRAVQAVENIRHTNRMRPHSYYHSAEEISEIITSIERCTGDRELADDLRVLAECVRNLPQG